MGSDVPGGTPRPAGRPQEAAAEDSPRSGREDWSTEHARLLADLTRTVDVMETVARVEMGVARTLQAMAARGGSEAGARRLELAREAIRGANTVIERSTDLQRPAYRWAAGGAAARLSQLLNRAAGVLSGLARAESELADTLMGLVGQNGAELAAQRRQLAHDASAGARRAAARARVLRELAQVSAVRMPPS